MHKQFTIKDLGEAKYCLGLEIARSTKGLFLNQRKCTLDLLAAVGLSDAKAADVPMIKNTKFSLSEGIKYENVEQYRQLVGKLLYLGFTRLDIAYATQQLSLHVLDPCQVH